MEVALAERLVGVVVAGKYRVRRIMGAGSMGVVCEAEHLEIGKRLAIKVIESSLAGISDIALRFKQEARAASLVESQHIVQVFDVGTDASLGLYLVMEYLTGEDLAQALSRDTKLPPDVAVRIALQVARGLSKAHEAGVVHRDLKPANIFLAEREDDEPLVKILDFGISKVIDASRADSKLKLTRAGTVVGTPQYMSPEQAQGYAVDERTDVWALGLVLYEMLAGRPAYLELPTYEQFIIHLVQHPPDALKVVAPWVPANLAEVVHAAIEHDLAKRVPSCAELARALIEAHPIRGMTTARESFAVAADTWADQGTRSPYADDAFPRHDTPLDDEPAPVRHAAHSGIVFDAAHDPHDPHDAHDPLDVDVEISTERPPPPSGRPAAGHAGPAASAGPKLASSGVRAPALETSAEEADDAPQFFDRSALDRVKSSPSPAAMPPSPAPSSPSPRAGVPVVLVGSKKASMVDTVRTRRKGPTRFPIAWAAIAFITVGLVVALALALR